MNKPHDTIFSRPRKPVDPFTFNDEVVRVFDDMITRSVPGYREIILRQAQLAARFYRAGTRIYDLGCSNGNFGAALSREMADRPFDMAAVDNSEPMLRSCRHLFKRLPARHRFRLICANIQDIVIRSASVVLVNFTLQFLPVAERDRLIRRIFDGLVPGGLLLLSEKVIHADEFLKELQIEFYYRFKKENGYSELEISQKREALEDVLIPETIETHQKRLKQAGFEKTDIWHKWFNFTAMLAIKNQD